MSVRLAWIVVGAVLFGACGEEPRDATPTGAVRAFVEAMKRTSWDQEATREAYELLARESREELARRAELATSLAGRQFEPWEMLVRGRFHLRVSPDRPGATEERIDGDRATVVVRAASDDRKAEVSLVREGERWRLVLEGL